MLTVKRLRCFVAVAEEGQFNKAAARLGISQPPLSEHIRQLEGALNCRLFERTTRSLRLTDQGKALLQHVSSILLEIDRTPEVLANAGREFEKRLRVGLLHAHSYTFLPKFLEQYLDRYPHTELQLVEYSTTMQVETLLSGAVDIGFVREPVSHKNIETRNLFTEPYVLAIPSRLRFRGSVPVSVCHRRTLLGYPSHDDRRSTRSLFGDFLRRYEVVPSGYREVTTMHSALALVAAGVGVAPVPRSQSTLRLDGVSYHTLKQPPPTLAVGIAWPKKNLAPNIQGFLQFATSYFSKEGVLGAITKQA